MEAIFNRRSIRKFKDKKVSKEKICKLIKAAMQAPSAGNQKPWEFLVIEDEKTIKKVANMSLYSKFIAHAPLVIIVLGNKNTAKYLENIQQDLGAATQNMMLQGVEINLGSTWVGVALPEREEFLKNLFNLPEEILPYAVVPFGYPDSQENKFINRFDESKIFYNHYR